MLSYLLSCNFQGCKAVIMVPKLAAPTLQAFPEGWVRIGTGDYYEIHLCPEHADLLQVKEN